MNILKNPRLLKFVILLLCPMLSIAVWYLPWSNSIDLFSYDYLLNHSSYSQSRQASTVVIAIDDESLARFPEPLILWHKYYAAIISAAAMGEAKVIGLDVIPSISLDTVSPEYDKILVKAIRNSAKKGSSVILGFSAGKNGALPNRKFLLSASGVGFVNLTPDKDKIIRRQTLIATAPGKRPTKSFSLTLAQHLEKSSSEESEIPKKIYIDYRGPTPDTVSFAKIYDLFEAGDTASLQDIFKGKVALLGVTSVKLPDIHSTPAKNIGLNKQDIPGVFIHAITVETILGNDFFHAAQKRTVIVLLVLLSFLATFAAITFSPLITITAIILLFGAGYAFVFLAFNNAFIFPGSSLIAGLFIGSAIGILFKHTLEFWQFNRLQRYFKSYVHPDIMKEIIEDPSKVDFKGKKVTATIMFTDIRSFTTLSEMLEPEEVVSGLNQYFTEMTMSIIEEGGYLNRYLGDGILAIFGAPNKLPHTGALAAIKSGFNMLERLEELNKIKPFPDLDEIRIGIGLHTGDAIVGNIGCDEKMDYSIIGDAVNLAARIESQTKNFSTSMLVTEATYELVKDLVKAEVVTTTKVKGRQQDVKLYEIIKIL